MQIPDILGVSGRAALVAVLLVTTVPLAGSWSVAGAAFAGAAVSSVLVFGLAARGGFQQNRLVLVGFGIATAAAAAAACLRAERARADCEDRGANGVKV